MVDRSAPHPSLRDLPVSNVGRNRSSLLDVFSDTPSGLFDSPRSNRHVICLHVGQPVPVSHCAGRRERRGLRVHGQFCVVPAGLTSRWIMTQPVRSLLLRFTPSLVQETADAMGLRSEGAELAPSIYMRDPQVERIGWMLQAEDHDAYPGGRLFTDSLASALAVRLLALQLRQGNSDVKPARALPKWRLRNVLEYIEAHLDEDLTLSELATVAGFSLSHFKALFRQSVGSPVHRYVLERRVERARVLLLEGGRSMLEIALETGFAHPSHMARCMRRVLGVSPSQIVDSVS